MEVFLAKTATTIRQLNSPGKRERLAQPECNIFNLLGIY